MNKIFKPSLLILLALLVAACKAEVTRNNDGSLTVETEITQEQLQEIIAASISDPLVKDLTVSLQSGHVLVSGEHQRLNDASKTDTMSFRLDLTVSDGQPVAKISDAQIDGIAIKQNRVDNWNQTIGNRLSNFGGKNENATLQAIKITSESVALTWNVKKQ